MSKPRRCGAAAAKCGQEHRQLVVHVREITVLSPQVAAVASRN